MLNSNYFSKRFFSLNNEALNLWLQCNFKIAFGNKNDLDKQHDYFANYIRFLNYREKHIQKVKHTNSRNEDRILVELLEKELLNEFDLSSFTKYINSK